MTNAPLAGLRVLELARILAGPWAGQLLADLGADVVKVEAPEGDDTRRWGPPFVPGHGERHIDAAYFHSTNRGKRSIVADFAREEGRDLVRRLAGHADVLIENFKVGGLVKYGLDPASLMQANPRLVYCSITGFGQTGPYASRPGYDFIVQGMGGIMSIQGEPEGEPLKSAVAFADVFTGLYASNAVLAALHERARTGRGRHIDVSLLDTQVAVLGNQAMQYLVTGRAPERMGNAHTTIVPYQVFPCADGHIIIAAGNDGQFARLCGVLGVPEWAGDPASATNPARVANRATLVPRLAERTGGWPKAELLGRLEAVGVPVGPINSLDEVFGDPHVVARGMRVDLPYPEAAGGSVPGVRSPVVLDGAPAVAARPSPRLGAQGKEILADPAWGGAATPGPEDPSP